MKKQIVCDDVNCKFKLKNDTTQKQAQTCCLELQDAIEFMKRYHYTTCEVGMEQVPLRRLFHCKGTER